MAIKAIETVYSGYRFRSRLEARWAVFFDTLGIRYEYEKEGFDLDENGWYLPDFWMPTWDMWVEIKPQKAVPKNNDFGALQIIGELMTTLEKCMALAQHTQHDCLLVHGSPYPQDYGLALANAKEDAAEPYEMFDEFAGCRKCEGLWLLSEDGCKPLPDCDCEAERAKWPIAEAPRLRTAYLAARQARFEHGR